ncbi:protein S100-P [Apodemus sylvaticus]|uniref:protein S100-P n=1 Tax=Apodemus sylvaticus TaxID=10129 RepID=UPI0022418E31|nr:protein S100-P [Apodemus sylvaticus]
MRLALKGYGAFAYSSCLWLKRAKKDLKGRKAHTSPVTELETAICSIIKVFNWYAIIKGSDWRLGVGGVETLIQRELPGLLKLRKDKEGLNKLLKELDANRDAQVDFSEFMVFVAVLTSACHYSALILGMGFSN